MALNKYFIENIPTYHEQLMANKAIELEPFLEDKTLFYLSSLFQRDIFQDNNAQLDPLYQEKVLADEQAFKKVTQIFNTKEFLESMSRLFGEPILYTLCRVYYQDPEQSGYPWHSDIDADESIPPCRCGSIRISFCDATREEIDFEFRDTKTNQLISFREKGLGHARAFLIGPDYQHRVLGTSSSRRKSINLFVMRRKHKN